MDHCNGSALDVPEPVSRTAAKSVLSKSLSPSLAIEDNRRDHDGRAHRSSFTNIDSQERQVKFNGLKSVDTPFALPQVSAADVSSVCLPILCQSSSSTARSATPSPTCVSTFGRDEAVPRTGEGHEPTWTRQELQDYLDMLELLQDACSDTEGGDMWLSAACLGQMERLLTSLLPQGV